MWRPILSLACVLILSGCAAEAASPDTVKASLADENAEREMVLGAVRKAIASDDFAALDAMERNFRTSRARTPSGLWKLGVFHAGLQSYLAEGLDRDHGCQYRKAHFVERWRTAAPGEPASAITDAALLLKQAWCVRGGGYAATVSSQQWTAFRAKVGQAAEVLASQEATAAVDPEFHAVEMDLLRAKGAKPRQFRDALMKATDREAGYHRTYFNAAQYYLPQWNGDLAEVEAFARFAAERTQADEGDGLYARVFWSLAECDCDLIAQAADWATLKNAMRDVYARYPVRWNGEYFANLSCTSGDAEEGKRYLRAIHPEATGDGDLVAIFASCDMQARDAA